MSTTEEKIRQQIAENPVLLYMKGDPGAPKCGFSKAAVEALHKTEVNYSYIDILAAPFIREKLPAISHWPTFPQLFVSGELIGGSDVITDMLADGTLQTLVKDAQTRPLKEA
jgi:monothiol glutaredoxin